MPFSVEKSSEVSSVAEQTKSSWSSDISSLECHHQILSMVPLHVLNDTESTKTRCCFTVVWTLSGRCGCISLADFSS